MLYAASLDINTMFPRSCSSILFKYIRERRTPDITLTFFYNFLCLPQRIATIQSQGWQRSRSLRIYRHYLPGPGELKKRFTSRGWSAPITASTADTTAATPSSVDTSPAAARNFPAGSSDELKGLFLINSKIVLSDRPLANTVAPSLRYSSAMLLPIPFWSRFISIFLPRYEVNNLRTILQAFQAACVWILYNKHSKHHVSAESYYKHSQRQRHVYSSALISHQKTSTDDENQNLMDHSNL
jgi:hypothetical protein